MIKVHFILILIVLILRREVSGNTGLVGPVDSSDESIEDRFEEHSVKWNIDPDDMLKFEEEAFDMDDFNSEESIPVEDDRTDAQVDVAEENNDHEKPVDKINKYYGNKQASGGMEDTTENKIPPAVNAEMIQKEFNSFRQEVQDYITRYVHLFMKLLKIKKIPEDFEEFTEGANINFDFVINGKDLKTLCQLTRSFDVNNIIDNFRKIDSIFARSLKPNPKFTFYEELHDFVKKSDFGKNWWLNSSHYFYTPLFMATIMLAFKSFSGFSYKLIILSLINNMILMEGIFMYYAKLKEARIIDEVQRLKYKEVPTPCDADQSLAEKVRDWLFGDQCLEYHKTMQINRADSVSLFENVINAYMFYVLEMPLKVFGSAIRTFSVTVNDFLPPPFNMFAAYITQIIVLLSLILLFIVCFGLRINLFGRRVELDFSFWIRQRRRRRLDGSPPEYIRIQDLPLSLIREIEEQYIHWAPEYVVEGLDSVSKVVKDTGKVDNRQVEESHAEENNANEIVDEDVVHDNVQFDSKDKNLSQEIKTAGKVSAELKTSE